MSSSRPRRRSRSGRRSARAIGLMPPVCDYCDLQSLKCHTRAARSIFSCNSTRCAHSCNLWPFPAICRACVLDYRSHPISYCQPATETVLRALSLALSRRRLFLPSYVPCLATCWISTSVISLPIRNGARELDFAHVICHYIETRSRRWDPYPFTSGISSCGWLALRGQRSRKPIHRQRKWRRL